MHPYCLPKAQGHSESIQSMFAKETLEPGQLQGPFGQILLFSDEETKPLTGPLLQGSHTLVTDELELLPVQ